MNTLNGKETLRHLDIKDIDLYNIPLRCLICITLFIKRIRKLYRLLMKQ
jgi:hypothetical protein